MTLSSDTTHPEAAKRATRSVAFITLAACLIFWVFVFADSGWGPILTPLSSYLHISLVSAGLLYVVCSTGYLPGALVGGALLDRYGARLVLFIAALIPLFGVMLMYLSLFLPFFAPLVALLVLAGLAGVGGGTIDAATNGLISSIFARNRGMALNLFNLLYPLGGIVVALVDSGLLTRFHNDPRPSFLFTLGFIGVDVDPLLWRLQSEDLPLQLFVDDGTRIVQGGVPPSPIVETLKIVKCGLSSLSSCEKLFSGNTFVFEAVKEALHGRIVVTIARPAHAHLNPFVFQESLIAFTRVGTSPVRHTED